jgi:hypothetical protein
MVLENGISTDAMPDDEERTRRVLEKIVMGAPTLLADPNVAAAMGLDIEISPVAAGVDAEVGPGGELETPEPEPVPDNVRALPGTQGEEPEPEAVPEGLVAAAELIVYDALSRAGGRLLTNQNRGQFKSTPRHELHTVVAYEYGQIGRLLEGSFEFAEGVAESLGENPQDFTSAVRGYVAGVLSVRQPHDRDILARTLRRALASRSGCARRPSSGRGRSAWRGPGSGP